MSLDDALQNTASELNEPMDTQEPAVVDPIDSLEDEPELPQLTEIESLRARADQLGLKYRSNTGVEKLRALVTAAIEGTDLPQDDEGEENTNEALTTENAAPVAATLAVHTGVVVTNEIPTVSQLTPQQERVEARREARKLVRIRITCHNPSKSEWEGEIFTFGNGVVGTLKRFVPYETEWHVENAIFEMIKGRKYQHFYTIKSEDGRPTRTSKLVNEFSIEVLPSLTEDELKDLAQRQAMAAGTAE